MRSRSLLTLGLMFLCLSSAFAQKAPPVQEQDTVTFDAPASTYVDMKGVGNNYVVWVQVDVKVVDVTAKALTVWIRDENTGTDVLMTNVAGPAPNAVAVNANTVGVFKYLVPKNSYWGGLLVDRPLGGAGAAFRIDLTEVISGNLRASSIGLAPTK